MKSKTVGKTIVAIVQDMHHHFTSRPEYKDTSVRLYGSLARSAVTGEVASSGMYDLDIDIITPNTSKEQINGIVEFFNQEAEKYQSKDLQVEAKAIRGPYKPKLDPVKQTLFLHLTIKDETSLNEQQNRESLGCKVLKPMLLSMREYGVLICGNLPSAARVERIGLVDILPEPAWHIERLLGRTPFNRVYEDGEYKVSPTQLDPNSLEAAGYAVHNNAKNILAAISPYLALPHFDLSEQAFRVFRKLFPKHPAKDLPLELSVLKKKHRNDEDVTIAGVTNEALNFLAYNDQMIRNMIGG